MVLCISTLEKHRWNFVLSQCLQLSVMSITLEYHLPLYQAVSDCLSYVLSVWLDWSNICSTGLLCCSRQNCITGMAMRDSGH
jgi:hypothetical protein